MSSYARTCRWLTDLAGHWPFNQPLITDLAHEDPEMLRLALMFALIALIAGALGFGGIAAGAAGIAKVLFVLFLVAFLVVMALIAMGVSAFKD
jgi:uncharacterized membrane protein YtjA (UPF0391 family)